MQACVITTRCDILLEGREQFLGHMIHGHDVSCEQADTVWTSMLVVTQKGA
jgi:hypothetical protein